MNTQLSRADEPGTEYGLSRLWLVFRSNLRLICAVVVVTVVAAVAATMLTPVGYRSTVTLVIRDPDRGDIEPLTRTLAALLRGETIGDDIRLSSGIDLSAEEISDKISVAQPPGSGVLEVSAVDSDRERSFAIAKAVVPAFAYRVEKRLEAGHRPTADVQAWDSSPATERIPRPLTRNGGVALLLGMVLAGIVVAVRERISPALASADEAEAALGLPVLGALPALDASGRKATSLDEMRTILSAAQADGWGQMPRSVLVAGPASARERALFSFMLGVTLADSGKDVVIVDADTESRELSKKTRLRKTAGLAEALTRGLDPERLLVGVKREQLPRALRSVRLKKGALRILPAGKGALDEAFLGSERMTELLAAMPRNAIVIVNGPSLSGGAPISTLASSVDRVLAVVAEGSSAWSARSMADLLRSRNVGASAVMVSSSRLEIRTPVATASGGHSPSRAPRRPTGRGTREG